MEDRAVSTDVNGTVTQFGSKISGLIQNEEPDFLSDLLESAQSRKVPVALVNAHRRQRSTTPLMTFIYTTH
eukprot:2331872-Rhodomonas_salina.6